MRNRIRKPKALVEPLEDRRLLTAAQFATPTYIVAKTGLATVNAASPSSTPGEAEITPAQMVQAYGVNSIKFGSVVGNGAGQTIAIIDAYDDPNAASDLATFDSTYGLPAPPSFTKLSQTGTTTLPGPDTTDPKGDTWELEESLDIEWAHVIAPDASIILYEANSASYANLVTHAVNTARKNASVSVISMSWGGGEGSGEQSYDTYFTTPSGHQGVTFVASTGDDAAPAGYPSFSPNVVAVGGTTLLVSDSAGDYYSESAWSDGGGGTSTLETEPAYQQSVQSTGYRTVPDVSMDANPYTGVPVYDTYDGGWFQVGGTSLASPMFAAVVAIADQGRVHYGLGTLDGPTQTLPYLYQLNSFNFHDITTGNDGFAAGPGYDEATGIGSPVANLLVPDLAQPVITNFTASPSIVTAGTNITLTAAVSDVNGPVSSVSFYLESDATPGLQTGAGGDTLLGAGTLVSGVWTFAASTTNLSGPVTYYAVATDSHSIASPAATATATIAPLATASFVKSDTTTTGAWSGVYGSDGYDVFNSGVSLPSYASVTASGQQSFTWSGVSGPADSRGLQVAPGSSTTIDSCYFSATSFTLNVNLTDGQSHQVALYLLDWENAGRAETIQLTNAASGAVLDTRSVSNFSGGIWLVWNLSGDVNITITNTAGLNAVASGLMFDPGVTPGSASFVKSDTTTTGAWSGVYGSDGYDVFNSGVSLPSYASVTASGQQSFTWSGVSGPADSRGLQVAPGSSTTIDSCYFSATSFTLNVNLTDGQSHQVALYLLDWENAGRAETIQLTNAASGAVLDTRSVSNFSGGIWLVWNLSGDVNITITNTAGLNAVASGLMFDPGVTPGSASFVKSDTTTTGAWSGVYGSDGYDVFNSGVSLPSYASVTASGQQSFTWSGVSGPADSRGLQVAPGSSTTIDSCYFSATSFTLNVNLTDGQSHQVALYLLDWENAGRAETIQLTNAASGAVLDTRSVSNFSGGIWLVWNLSGDVNITITNTAGLNAVASGLMFDPGVTPGSASFVKSDTTTTGAWSGVYGSDGYDVFNSGVSLPSYASVTASGQQSFTWSGVSGPADSRGLQVAPGSSTTIDSCYFSATSFTLNVNLTDGQSHQVALYLLDWENAGRAETIQLTNAASGAVLDTRSVSNFSGGIWLVWNLSGDVNITITNTAGLNAVASGLMFDPVI